MDTKFTYVGIRVKDMAKSVEFYTKFLGMKNTGNTRIEAAKGDATYLVSHGRKIGLELNHYDSDSPFNTKYVVGEGLDHLAFGVKDLDAALKEAERMSYRYVTEVKTEKSRWAYVEDRNGIWVELFEG